MDSLHCRIMPSYSNHQQLFRVSYRKSPCLQVSDLHVDNIFIKTLQLLTYLVYGSEGIVRAYRGDLGISETKSTYVGLVGETYTSIADKNLSSNEFSAKLLLFCSILHALIQCNIYRHIYEYFIPHYMIVGSPADPHIGPL